ncbi:SpoIIE family protein phosphatase [Rhodococcus sp. Z13]|uniref:SpoIIE family protein phosphatase n=1 Tax=Rhodococcus sacchari TaxID=2962047 RepID=A0ACD4DL40_9NOCA|nr:SpoIIE family protein phosphatase [Rhodococcus sp. Z13]UYP20688.1 SpoIIE family protein phosphatase [Rhodococcus sp. Z13]
MTATTAYDDAIAALLTEDAETLYDKAPCGYVTSLPDGRILRINATLLDWLGYSADEVVGHRRFSDLLTVGGRLYHETHYAPILLMQGEIGGIALELARADRTRLPVLAASRLETDAAGGPLLVRTTFFDARERRSYETELLRARREAEQERERLRRITTTLQATLLPPALPAVPGLEVDAHYHIASPDEVGGDFYDLFPARAGGWGMFLGDVCGKGARAATVTSLVRYTLRAAAVHVDDPAAVLRTLNAALLDERERDPRTPFCTLLFGTVVPDPATGGVDVHLASGGHPPPLVLRADGSAERLPTVGGQPIGVLPSPRLVNHTVRLEPGDTLLLYTDGVTEAIVPGPEGPGTGRERFGEDRLLAHVRAVAPASASRLVGSVREMLDTLGAGVQDDVALLAVGSPARGAHQPRSASRCG